MKCAFVGLSVGPEHNMLTCGDFGVYIAQRHGVLLGLGGVVGNVDAGNFHRGICRVEKLDPSLMLSVVVYIV